MRNISSLSQPHRSASPRSPAWWRTGTVPVLPVSPALRCSRSCNTTRHPHVIAYTFDCLEELRNLVKGHKRDSTAAPASPGQSRAIGSRDTTEFGEDLELGRRTVIQISAAGVTLVHQFAQRLQLSWALALIADLAELVHSLRLVEHVACTTTIVMESGYL